MVWDIHKNIAGSDILVVDDNIINLKVLCGVLEKNGYVTRKAINGDEAIEAVKLKKPDLILLDVQMPGMDGFQVCKYLHTQEETKDIPIIFITASDSVESKLEGFEVGASDYISRPLQMPEVLARVSNQLITRAYYRQSRDQRDRLEKLINALPVPYVMANKRDGKIIEFNKKARFMLNLPLNVEDSINVLDFFSNVDDFEALIDLLFTDREGESAECQMLSYTKDEFTALCSMTELDVLSDTIIFITFNDISERKKAEAALRKAANIDYLTETLNRRAFSQKALMERARADRNKSSLSLLMIDIDHFKVINDTFGHNVGDKALKTLVYLIEKDLRVSDVLGRVGGEEFVLLLPETPMDGAQILAERIRTRIDEYSLNLLDGKMLKMTISGGLIEWESRQDYEEALKIADRRLYKAKKEGRNRIISSDD